MSQKQPTSSDVLKRMKKKNLHIQVVDNVLIKDKLVVEHYFDDGIFLVFEPKYEIPYFENPLFEGVNTYGRPPTPELTFSNNFFKLIKL